MTSARVLGRLLAMLITSTGLNAVRELLTRSVSIGPQEQCIGKFHLLGAVTFP
jgi:hypothetical protein